MKTSEIEHRVREYFNGEVAVAKAGLGGEGARRRRWWAYPAAAAALALLPVLMVVGRTTLDPLASVIDRRWNEVGRQQIEKLLRAADGVLDMQNTNREE